jgi:hypothetical protein
LKWDHVVLLINRERETERINMKCTNLVNIVATFLLLTSIFTVVPALSPQPPSARTGTCTVTRINLDVTDPIAPLRTYPNVYIFRGAMRVIFGGGLLGSMTFNVTVTRRDTAGIVPAVISLMRDSLTPLSDYRRRNVYGNYSLIGIPVPSRGWVWIPSLTTYEALPAQTPVYPISIIVGTTGGSSVSVILTWYEDGVTSALPANATWEIGAQVGIAPGAGGLFIDINPGNNQAWYPPSAYNCTAWTATTETLSGSTTYEPYYSIRGDINGDGRVDILDAIALSNQFLKTGNSLSGDINNDGVVNILDAVLLANNFNRVFPFLVGLPTGI